MNKPHLDNNTPLLGEIKRRIQTDGMITVAEYMRLCLQHPTHGYYTAHDEVIGGQGDFITAPEISQLFGEMIGVWLFVQWQNFGRPKHFQLLEAGPGRATLMSDALRALKKEREFIEAIELFFLESSQPLQKKQATAIKNLKENIKPQWIKQLEDLPTAEIPLFFVANEFYDALPVHQFERSGDQWLERLIAVDQEGELRFALSPTKLSAVLPLQHPAQATRKQLEISPAVMTVHQTLINRFKTTGGSGLVIDYGYGPDDDHGNTLQAVRQHKTVSPLSTPGECDLTTHVDFGQLEHINKRHNLPFSHFETQATFLKRYGIESRLSRLLEIAPPADQTVLSHGVERLIGADKMGTLFKTLHFAAPIPGV